MTGSGSPALENFFCWFYREPITTGHFCVFTGVEKPNRRKAVFLASCVAAVAGVVAANRSGWTFVEQARAFVKLVFLPELPKDRFNQPTLSMTP